MARTAKATAHRGKKPRASRATLTKAGKQSLVAKPGAATLTNIQEIQKDGMRKHGKAGSTTKKYDKYVAAGRRWLAGHYEDGEQPGKLPKPNATTNSGGMDVDGDDEDPSFLAPNFEEDHNISSDPVFNEPTFKVAFEDKPNKHSPKALSLFLLFKIFQLDLSQSTADGIRAAFI